MSKLCLVHILMFIFMCISRGQGGASGGPLMPRFSGLCTKRFNMHLCTYHVGDIINRYVCASRIPRGSSLVGLPGPLWARP